MNRLRTEERGGIFVLAAFMIPVFIVMTALVVDVGQWYTHKRQLQNRADAAAFAAGIEYAKNWKACVQTGDAALKASTAREIANKARQFAADPEAADYAPDAMPGTLYNSGIANQSKLDVVVNSWNYADDNDYSDDEPGVPASPSDADPGDPCFIHTPGTDNISPGGGQWTDVRVKENDLPSLFGAIGLPLDRNVARARIEIRPALSQKGFLPLAVPNTIVTKVQVRYFDECRDPNHNTPLVTRDLYPVPNTNTSQMGYAAQGGGTLWAPASSIPAPPATPVGDPAQSISLPIPSYQSSCGDYLAVGMQVRLASRDGIDLNQSCATLKAIDYAECFNRLTTIRVWNDGNPDSQPRIKDVNLTGGCGLPGDAYFSAQVLNGPNCNFGVSADIDWGTRDDGNRNVDANFTVTANGAPMTQIAGPCCSGVYSTNGTPITFGPAANGNNITITLDWDDNNNGHQWPPGTNCGGNRCEYNGTQSVQRAFVGADTEQFRLSGPVALVRTSRDPSQAYAGCAGCTQPGVPFANVNTGGGSGIPSSPVVVYPSVGLKTPLKTGDLVTLRFDDSQGTGLLRCDPDFANGQTFETFRVGCKPWYGANSFQNGTWWNTATNSCPDPGQWFNYNMNPSPFFQNGPGNPWRCVPTAPGGKTGQVGDWMAVATKNCNRINNNSCQQIGCNYSGNYDGIDSDGNGVISPAEAALGWKQQGGDSRYPRVVNLYVVPYEALKTKQGSGDPVPILGFASFFVMEWGGVSNDDDPCPDRTWDHDDNPATAQVTLQPVPKRAIRGIFVEKVEYEPGPVDPNAICVEGQLTPCRVTLVR